MSGYDDWTGAVAGTVVSIFVISLFGALLLVGFLGFGIVAGGGFLAYKGYQKYLHRHDPPQLGPWSEPGDTPSFGDLFMGDKYKWD